MRRSLRVLLVHSQPIEYSGEAERSLRAHIAAAPPGTTIDVILPDDPVDLQRYDTVVISNLHSAGGLGRKDEYRRPSQWVRRIKGYRGYVIKLEHDVNPCTDRDERCVNFDNACDCVSPIPRALEEIYHLCDAIIASHPSNEAFWAIVNRRPLWPNIHRVNPKDFFRRWRSRIRAHRQCRVESRRLPVELVQSSETGKCSSATLHLHVGAHKTATTHFQNVMLLNRNLYEKNTHYVSMDEFRNNVTHASRLLEPCYNKEIAGYLGQLERTEKQNLIISEENLIGEVREIYGSKRLYRSMERRASRLTEFVSRFSDATIWISIRSMDTFIPSLYCESLLHLKFRRFSHVFSGRYEQSWIPIILSLRDNFPNAKINVVPYETYETILPKWLGVMTGVQVGWDLQKKERPRALINPLSLKIMNYAHLFIPSSKTPDALQAMSGYFVKKGKGGKFSPFNDSEKSKLKALYMKDLEEIDNLGGNICLFKG